ncbi:MAG TPA: hypothetical protein EYP51_05545, partial [Thiotrichales bacterium]|nr:hypothetical protein [Thiotrichales bacterium]
MEIIPVIEDRLNHASLIDGGRLSGARLRRYPHGDLAHIALRPAPVTIIRGQQQRIVEVNATLEQGIN